MQKQQHVKSTRIKTKSRNSDFKEWFSDIVTLKRKNAEKGEIWGRRGRQVRLEEACHAETPAQPQGIVEDPSSFELMYTLEIAYKDSADEVKSRINWLF